MHESMTSLHIYDRSGLAGHPSQRPGHWFSQGLTHLPSFQCNLRSFNVFSQSKTSSPVIGQYSSYYVMTKIKVSIQGNLEFIIGIHDK